MRPDDLVLTWKALRSDHDAGRLDWDGLVRACADLRTRDAEGRWWAVDAAGRLLVFDDAGQRWTEAPRAAPPPPSPQPAARRRTRRSARTEPAAAEDEEGRAAVPARLAVVVGDGRFGPPMWVAGRAPPPAASEAAPAAPFAERAKATVITFGFAFCLSLAVSWLGWDLLAVVPLAINGVIPTGSCTGFQPASIGMYLCSALVGLRVVFGSLVLAVVMVILRKPIMAAVGLINKAIPPAFRSVLPAVVAAVFFAVVWAGSHASTGDLKGILPHRAFPALVGVFVQATMTWGPATMARLSLFFRARDVLPKLFRWVLVILVPLMVSLWITAEDRVSNEAYKQQLVVLIGMAAAWVLMTPRTGRLGDLQSDLGAGPAAGEARRAKSG